MNRRDLTDKTANLGAFQSLEAAQRAGYRLVKARDADRYYLAQDRDLQPLLVRLGDIAEVRRGFTTGANEFFYLEPVDTRVADLLRSTGVPPVPTVRVKNGAGWQGEIEASWLRPVIKSPRELKTLRVRPEDLRFLVLMPPDAIREKLPLLAASGELKKRYPRAWAYIQWGEKLTIGRSHQGKQKVGTPLPQLKTLSTRQLWWAIDQKRPADFFCNRFFNDRFFFCSADFSLLEDQTLYGGFVHNEALGASQIAILNSTISLMFASLLGRVGLGEGVLQYAVYEMQLLTTVNAAALTAAQCERLLEAFEKLAAREVKSIFEELGLPKPNKDYSNIRVEEVSLERVLPDRRALDAVVFEVLGLSEQEQLAVYRAVVDLVKSRLVKAQSVG